MSAQTTDTTTTTGTNGDGDVVELHRRRIDRYLIAFGIVAAVVFVVAGGLLRWGSTFAHDYVQDELSSQNVVFPSEDELREEGREAPRLATNNFGFVSPYNFPIVRSGNEFIIGIFGGSVGVWFCQVGVERLLADLQQHEFFKARTLVPLCMAHEGYKQPQQLLVLAYFLSIGQPFDLVINIDGFNEVAISPLNNQQNLDISMPSASHLIPLINLIDKGTLTPRKLQSLSAIARGVTSAIAHDAISLTVRGATMPTVLSASRQIVRGATRDPAPSRPVTSATVRSVASAGRCAASTRAAPGQPRRKRRAACSVKERS